MAWCGARCPIRVQNVFHPGSSALHLQSGLSSTSQLWQLSLEMCGSNSKRRRGKGPQRSSPAEGSVCATRQHTATIVTNFYIYIYISSESWHFFCLSFSLLVLFLVSLLLQNSTRTDEREVLLKHTTGGSISDTTVLLLSSMRVSLRHIACTRDINSIRENLFHEICKIANSQIGHSLYIRKYGSTFYIGIAMVVLPMGKLKFEFLLSVSIYI